MAVAEGRANGVVTNQVPTLNCNTREFLGAIAAVFVTENIDFANVLGAGRMLAQELGRKIAFAAVVPENAEFGADELDV